MPVGAPLVLLVTIHGYRTKYIIVLLYSYILLLLQEQHEESMPADQSLPAVTFVPLFDGAYTAWFTTR